MNTQALPPSVENLTTEQCRQRLAGLIDPQPERAEWYAGAAKELSIDFVSCLPSVFGSELDRKTMWNKIPAAIQSAHAKTVSGDIDLFVQCVLESLQADASQAVCNERLIHAIERMQSLNEKERQDLIAYMASHLITVCVHARRLHRENLDTIRSGVSE